MGITRDEMRQLTHLLRPLATRIANTVVRGVVQLVNDGKKLQLLQVGGNAGETLDGATGEGAEHFQAYGFSSVPLAGAETIVIRPNGDCSHQLVIATSDRRYRPTGGEPGEVTMYNNAGASMTMTKDGDIIGMPAPGRSFKVSDAAGGAGAGPLVSQAQFLNHTHATAGTGPPTPPTAISPAPALTGTTVLQGK